MIVKIRNKDGHWSYFECNSVHSHYGKIKDIEVYQDAFIMVKDETRTSGSNTGILILHLETEKTHLKNIITDDSCYIINSEGKTIDRL